MKTREQFRGSIGAADEDFRRVIRQTLCELQREEEQPVKRKISMGLALAMVIMLLTVTAVAASQWGILDFIREQGKEPAEEKLVSTIAQICGESKWISVTVDEALIDGDTAYLAMTILPKTEQTIIMPIVMDLSAPGGMAVMNNPAYDAEMSIRDFAASKGFEKIIGFEPLMDGAMQEKRSAVYESLENGGLRCIMEYGYSDEEDFPERTKWYHWTVLALDYCEDNIRPDHARESQYESVVVEAEIPVSICADSRKSLASDAHDIVGYKGYIEYITITPIEDGSVQFTMLIDMNDADDKKVYFYTPSLMDSEGNELFWCNGSEYNMGSSNKRLLACTIPAEYASNFLEDHITISVYSMSGTKPVYDTYTYTLE